MRLDKLIEQRQRQKEFEQPKSVVIYDPEAPGAPERPKGATGVVFFIPDNGRD